MAPTPKSHCDECGKLLTPGPWFKRFCDDGCRAKYHKERRDRAMELLDQEESEEEGDDAR